MVGHCFDVILVMMKSNRYFHNGEKSLVRLVVFRDIRLRTSLAETAYSATRFIFQKPTDKECIPDILVGRTTIRMTDRVDNCSNSIGKDEYFFLKTLSRISPLRK